jgi:hypothetical protein
VAKELTENAGKTPWSDALKNKICASVAKMSHSGSVASMAFLHNFIVDAL